MTTDAPAADSGILTIDQAVAQLDAADKQEAEAPAEADAASPPEGQNTPAEPAAETASEPETATDGETAETEDGKAEGDEPELPAIEPPRFWDAVAKNRFRELPRDIQELLAQNEDRSVKATAKSFQEAAEIRKAAEAEASNLSALRVELDKSLSVAKAKIKGKWEVLDQYPSHAVYWNTYAAQYGSDAAFQLKNDFEADQSALQKAEWGVALAEQVELKDFTAKELAKLPELAPDLVDPKTAPQRRAAIIGALTAAGYTAKQIERLDAFQAAALNDALKWREANAKAKTQAGLPQTTQTQPARPQKPTVRSTAAPSRSGSPQLSRLTQLNNKPRLSMDEAVERMDLMESLNSQ